MNEYTRMIANNVTLNSLKQLVNRREKIVLCIFIHTKNSKKKEIPRIFRKKGEYSLNLFLNSWYERKYIVQFCRFPFLCLVFNFLTVIENHTVICVENKRVFRWQGEDEIHQLQ